jgi:cytochrome c biogenesis protein CcmG, thiol:disulfide interchange protein DsbE
MRTFVVLSSLLLLCCKADAALAPSVSDDNNGPAPEFTVKPLNAEKEIVSKDLKGKPVMVSFFASWCPPCKKQIEELKEVYKENAPKGLVIIGAATDSKIITDTKNDEETDNVKEAIKNKEIPYAVGIASEKVAKDLKFKGIPTTIFIDRSGNIVKTFYGFHEKADFADAVKTIMAGEEKK